MVGRNGLVCCFILAGWLELYFHNSQHAYKRYEHDEIATYDLGLIFYSDIRRVIIPGIAFGAEGLPVAGVTREVRGYMIVVNGKMAPESSLSSFLHELGHATYMRAHPNGAERVAAEMAAILFFLEALGNEGLDELAYREARALTEMVDEPYKSAVARIADHPIWKKYSSPARP